MLPQNGVLTPLITAKPFTLSAGQPVVVPDLPVGAQCWAEETDRGGATATVVSHPGQAQPLTATAAGTDRITVTNTFAAAELSVRKRVVDGPAGPYSFEVSCTTALGEVQLDPQDAAFKLRDGETRTISVPVGALCTVEEIDVPKAAVVSYDDSTASQGGRQDGRVVVDPQASVQVTNTFERDVAGNGVGGEDDGGEDGEVASNGATAGDGDGILPSTGGPAMWLLPAGLLLLVAGAVAITLDRRRRS